MLMNETIALWLDHNFNLKQILSRNNYSDDNSACVNVSFTGFVVFKLLPSMSFTFKAFISTSFELK